MLVAAHSGSGMVVVAALDSELVEAACEAVEASARLLADAGLEIEFSTHCTSYRHLLLQLLTATLPLVI